MSASTASGPSAPPPLLARAARSRAARVSRDGELVREVVQGVSRMALHPLERHVAAFLDQVDEGLPKIAIGNGLVRRRHPVACAPALPPAVAEALDDVRGI